MPASPLTATELAKARRSWAAVLAMTAPSAQCTAASFWACLWASRLLEDAKVSRKIAETYGAWPPEMSAEEYFGTSPDAADPHGCAGR